MKNLKTKKQNFKQMNKDKSKTSGITLIALVVTIVVLLILAAVSISMLGGENGIITQAIDARNKTEIGEEKEKVQLAAVAAAGKGKWGEITRDNLIAELNTNIGEGKYTIEGDSIFKITYVDSNRSYIVDANGNVLDKDSLTLGSVYNDNMIGQNLTYSANGQNNWIVFGKDTNGNILITTELPIEDKYEFYGSVEKWLSYEDDLNNLCSVYGSTIQGISVMSRSITMDDINYVAGFTEPKFNKYTFGATSDYDNKKVNYYYPSLNASDNSYWQNPATVSAEFEDNWYGYYFERDDNKYYYYGVDIDTSEVDATTKNIKTENCKYIWGGNTADTCYKEYVVATRSVSIDPEKANFGVANVGYSGVNTDYYLCKSNSVGGSNVEDDDLFGIRPIVILPANLKVEQQSDGTYDLAK